MSQSAEYMTTYLFYCYFPIFKSAKQLDESFLVVVNAGQLALSGLVSLISCFQLIFLFFADLF